MFDYTTFGLKFGNFAIIAHHSKKDLYLRRLLLFSLLFFNILHGFTLTDRRVEDKVWHSGETFLGFLEENMLPLRLYYDLDDEDEKITSDIRTNTLYQILRNEDYEIEQVLIPLNEELQIHIFKDLEGKYQLAIEPIRYQTRERKLALKLHHIFSKDIVKATDNFLLSVELEQLYRKVFDFKRLKKGDRLAVLYREKIRLGKFYGTQQVHAALLESHGKKYYFFLNPKDGKYYDEKGKTKEKDGFIVPCKYRRISSVFTKKRWHPILRKYRAHHGIDYAGAIGTPIRAAYGGKVIFAGRKGGYGNTVVIKHKGGYKTLYAHLQRYKVFRGKRVKKGEVIGYLGNTGLSTGPHLHFGLSLNNVWINPARKIVFTKGLSGKERKNFMKAIAKYREELEKLEAEASVQIIVEEDENSTTAKTKSETREKRNG